MNEATLASAPRVRLGVPGLDKVFPDGVRAGSLIVITGPPGSGKTLLAAQLLIQMRFADRPDIEPRGLFLSADERERDLSRQIRSVLGLETLPIEIDKLDSRQRGEYTRYVRQQLRIKAERWELNEELDVLDGEWEQLSKSDLDNVEREAAQIDLAAQYTGLFARQKRHWEKEARRDIYTAEQQILRNASQKLCSKIGEMYQDSGRHALALDGVLNLAELRRSGRNALQRVAERLRHLVLPSSDEQPWEHMAAIMTAEQPSDRPGDAVHQLEEYLADVVIRLSVQAPAARKRRRLLEVSKARYAEAVLGEHSLWIMSPGEVKRRRITSATLGWSRHLFEEHVRPGIVVFPRMRWQAEQGSGPLSAYLQEALVSLRGYVSGRPSLASRIEGSAFHEQIARVLRSEALPAETIERARSNLQGLIKAAIAAGWTWPDTASALEPSAGCPFDHAAVTALANSKGWVSSLAPASGDNKRTLSDWVSLIQEETWETEWRSRLVDLLGKLRPSASVAKWPTDRILAALMGLGELEMVLTSLAQERTAYCPFGIDGIDSMLTDIRTPGESGVPRGSSTVIMGGAGTGKSTLAYSFMLNALAQDENVIFLSFDARHKRILRQAGGLQVSYWKEKRQEDSHTLAEMAAQQIVLADRQDDSHRLHFVYANPVNADLDELMFHVLREIQGSQFRASPTTRLRRRHCRLIVDSLTDLQRNIRDPLVYNDLVSTLLNNAMESDVTTLLVYEAEVPRTDRSPDSASLSFLADNVIVLRHVQVNNTTRKCVTVEKVRGHRHDPSVAELIFQSGSRPGSVRVRARTGFQGMSQVLSGHPKPVKVELRLFHENAKELASNGTFVDDMKRRFGDHRVTHAPFALAEARSTYWDREEGRDVSPDADLTVVSLDQPWVSLFARRGQAGDSPLAEWDPATADASQSLLVSQMEPGLRRHAELHSDGTKGLAPMIAWPQYFDMGMLLERNDILGSKDIRPTHWDLIDDRAAEGLGMSPADRAAADAKAFEFVVGELARVHDVPGFAANLEDVSTAACVYIEMCWNFFADPNFLACTNEKRRSINIDRATRALLFLARLRHKNIMPFPCSLGHCAEALYSRVWYANLPVLEELASNHRLQLSPIPFLTSWESRLQSHDMTKLVGCVEQATKDVDDKIERVRDLVAAPNIETFVDGAKPYHEPTYFQRMALREELLDLQMKRERLGDRYEELLQRATRARGLGGWSCSGAWYLGLISSGGNKNLGWSIIQEALMRERIEERAHHGVGLPTWQPFYREHDRTPAPGLTAITFGDLQRYHFARTRPREAVLGLDQTPRADPAAHKLLKAGRDLPEMLYGLVMTVVGDKRFDPTQSDAHEKIRPEVERVFNALLPSAVAATA